jgi:hypothetical protein
VRSRGEPEHGPTGGTAPHLSRDGGGRRRLQASPDYRGSEADVLRLQEAAGNSATTTLLESRPQPDTREKRAGKGPIEEGKPLKGRVSDFFKGLVGKGKAAATPNSQDVTVTPISAPTDLGRGGFSWDVWFSIANPAGKDGWVIQEIDADAKITKSDGSVIHEPYHFWEAWKLKKNKKTTIYQDEGLDTNDDRYYTGPRPEGSKGKDVTIGKVRFFEGPLPSSFKKNNPSTVAGILYSSTTAPPYWGGTTAAHNLTCEFDDSVKPSQTKIKTTP